MPQTPEAQVFLARIAQLPPGTGAADLLSQVLQPSLDDEAQLRKLWATEKTSPRLQDPYVGLVDIFDAPDDIRKARARVVTDETDLSAHYIHPLEESRRRKEGDPCMVPSLDEFKKNWGLFTEGSLSQLTDWNNVIAAGGSVLACLAPVPESARTSKRAMRKYFHNNAFPTSDVDLFLYGLTPEQAEAKMQSIYEAVRDSVPWDVTCVRTKHTVSIHSQYPYRSVQIVLRLYSSPAEILTGFDVDAPCCAFDGQRVWANPRSIVAMMRQCNTVDMTRRSPSYEVRLTKYALRDFEVYVPTLRREDIDPTIFERSIQRVQGLARLLVLERFLDAESRQRYLLERRRLRNRPEAHLDYRRRKKALKGDLKGNVDIGGLEMNDYDVVSLHIPYGPGWDARRIDKLVYQTDLGMNSPYNPKNEDRRLHRHPAFFGTLQECLEDCCEFCPEAKDDEEKELQEKEDESYVRGRVQFIEEDPGRQSISGSFNPIDDGEWAEQAYMGPTEKLFNAIVLGDRAALAKIIAEEGTDLDRRDHVGRTPLQIAILAKEIDVACDLIDSGARMTSRLVDGRTALHLAAQLDLPVVIRKLLERSAVNAEKAKEEEEEAKCAKEAKNDEKMQVDEEEDAASEDIGDDDSEDGERGSSEDDWSSDGEQKDKEQKQEVGQIPEDEDVPDVFDVNLPDWDYALTPLQYAVIFGSLGAIDELLTGGADATIVTKMEGWQSQPFHPMTLTALIKDPGTAGTIVNKLASAGATSSQADDNLVTIFHRLVCAGKPQLVESILSNDPSAKAVLDSPAVQSNFFLYPIVSSIAKNQYATLAVLLAFGAKMSLTEKDYSVAMDLRKSVGNYWPSGNTPWQWNIYWPVDVAINQVSDTLSLLIGRGADLNITIKPGYVNNVQRSAKKTILDAVRGMIVRIKKDMEEESKGQLESSDKDKFRDLSAMPGWKGKHGKHLLKIVEDGTIGQSIDAGNSMARRLRLGAATDRKLKNYKDSVEYLTKAEELLTSHGAKTWRELHPDDETDDDPSQYFRSSVWRSSGANAPPTFSRYTNQWYYETVPTHLVPLYEELFQACCDGDNAKIEALCLPEEGKSDRQPIQIGSIYGEQHWGVTPLYLALQYRHWASAKLILAIAVAQYKPRGEKAPKFSVRKVALEDDSEDGSDEDEDDMDEDDDEPAEVSFIDIAQRRSAVETQAPPERMLQQAHRWQEPKTKLETNGNVLFRAVMDDDFEAFVQIADLYKSLPKALHLPSSTLTWILDYDRSTMLDEYIRRTGAGIEPPSHEVDEEETQITEERKSKKLPPKTYLGLNVHGKKRKDLVAKSDPNAPAQHQNNEELPLLWEAAHRGATECVRYLSSERPLSAYQYYASTHSNERAQYIKRIKEQIPQRLGWASDQLNESVVTATVIGDHLDILKAVIDLQPAQLQAALMARIQYVGWNHIMVAANWGCSTEMFDYLLSKGVSPSETDTRYWNVLHVLCAHNTTRHMKLLKHILDKLPEDLVVRMLQQQSKGAENTPLHIAVRKGSITAVRLLLRTPACTLLLRDRDGHIPLHLAVQATRPEISRMVGEAGPDEAFTTEDGVGNTPLEVAVSNWLKSSVGTAFGGDLPHPNFISDSLYQYQQDRHHASESEVKELKETLDRLFTHGRLRKGTKLASDLTSWADQLEADAKKRMLEDQSAKDPSEDDPEAEFKQLDEGGDPGKTLDYIVEVLSKKPGLRRQLVHLIDVHRSVRGTLEATSRQQRTLNDYRTNVAAEEGLDAEVVEDKVEKTKQHSAVSKWHTGSFSLFDDDTI